MGIAKLQKVWASSAKQLTSTLVREGNGPIARRRPPNTRREKIDYGARLSFARQVWAACLVRPMQSCSAEVGRHCLSQYASVAIHVSSAGGMIPMDNHISRLSRYAYRELQRTRGCLPTHSNMPAYVSSRCRHTYSIRRSRAGDQARVTQRVSVEVSLPYACHCEMSMGNMRSADKNLCQALRVFSCEVGRTA